MVIKPVVNVKMLSFNHKSAKKVLQLQITAVFVFFKVFTFTLQSRTKSTNKGQLSTYVSLNELTDLWGFFAAHRRKDTCKLTHRQKVHFKMIKKVSIAHIDTTHNTDCCLFCGITRLSKHMNPTYFLFVFQKLLWELLCGQSHLTLWWNERRKINTC